MKFSLFVSFLILAISFSTMLQGQGQDVGKEPEGLPITWINRNISSTDKDLVVTMLKNSACCNNDNKANEKPSEQDKNETREEADIKPTAEKFAEGKNGITETAAAKAATDKGKEEEKGNGESILGFKGFKDRRAPNEAANKVE